MPLQALDACSCPTADPRPDTARSGGELTLRPFAKAGSILWRPARSSRELIAEHRQAADGCFLCHLVLDDVPVLGQLAVLEAHDIHHDPVRRPAQAAKPAVEEHVVAIASGKPVLVVQSF